MPPLPAPAATILGLSVALPLQEGPDSGRDRCCEREHAASSGRLLSLSSLCGEFLCVFLWPDSSFLFYHCCAFFCIELKYKHQKFTVTACEPSVQWLLLRWRLGPKAVWVSFSRFRTQAQKLQLPGSHLFITAF